MSVLLGADSPSEHSRSAALLDAVPQRLQLRDVDDLIDAWEFLQTDIVMVGIPPHAALG